MFCGPETRVCIRPENIVVAVKFTNFSTGDVGIIVHNCTGHGETTQAQDEKPIIDLVSHMLKLQLLLWPTSWTRRWQRRRIFSVRSRRREASHFRFTICDLRGVRELQKDA
jgi:hypothetical protein